MCVGWWSVAHSVDVRQEGDDSAQQSYVPEQRVKKPRKRRMHHMDAVVHRLHPTPGIYTMNLDDNRISDMPEGMDAFAPMSYEQQRESVVLPKASVVQSSNATGDAAPQSARSEEADEQRKRQQVQTLVDSAVTFLQQHPEDVAFNMFTHDPAFRVGDIYVFVYDPEGICLAQGELSSMVWNNNYMLKDQFGVFVIQSILAEARSPQHNGWVTYQWRNTTKNSYVKQVIKNDRTYVVGAGYYPHSKRNAVMGLVRGAVALFNDTVKRGAPVEAAFSVMSYPKGRFVMGDLYLYALDFDGYVVAHGERFDAISTNEIDYKDAHGLMLHREIIRLLREKGTGIWIDYESKGAPKKAYAERVVDGKGKEYFIACGYYPDSTKDHVVDLVVKGARYLDQHGETQAIREINKTRRRSAFVFGDLYLYLFSMDGVCLAHGGNEELVGKNLIDEQDETGFYYIKDLIKKAESGGGWVDYKSNNTFFSAYVEQVEVGLKNYVIGSGIYPVSTFETQVLLTRSAVSEALKSLKFACAKFADPLGKYVRGDLGVFVLDTSGILHVYKDRGDLVWKNLLNAQDDYGNFYIQAIIEQGLQGASTVTYNLLGVQATAYVESVTINEKQYIVGSESYL